MDKEHSPETTLVSVSFSNRNRYLLRRQRELQEYNYLPLTSDDEIRLLQILPGARHEELKCDILHYHLSYLNDTLGPLTPPKSSKGLQNQDLCLGFEALSYCWGDSGILVPVPCGGRGSYVSATQNCVAALRRFRRWNCCRLLWVDALCINQSDVRERNKQLLLMSRIYRSASQVLIYLGEETHDSDFAMDLILSHQGMPRSSRLPTSQEKGALQNFFSRPWFSRIWVLQEVAWSKSAIMVCGSRFITWQACLEFSKYPWSQSQWSPISENHPVVPLPFIVTMSRSNPIIANYTPTEFFSLLVQSRNCLSTDPRDKIFALLPLFAQRGANFPTVDYSSSVRDIYTAVAAMLLREHGAETLSTILHSQLEQLPSWATDWSLPPDSNRLSFQDILKFHYFKPSRYLKFHPLVELQFSAGGSPDLWKPGIHHVPPANFLKPALRIKVVEFDMIAGMTEGCDVRVRGWEQMVFRDWPRMLPFHVVDSDVDIDPISECYKTMMMMSNTEEEPWIPQILEVKSWFAKPGSFALAGDGKEAIRTLYDRTELICHGRSLMITRKGATALGPPNSRLGDVICILEGAATPFVLRPLGPHFSLIGECYVRGIMHGELLQEDGSNNRTGLLWKEIEIT